MSSRRSPRRRYGPPKFSRGGHPKNQTDDSQSASSSSFPSFSRGAPSRGQGRPPGLRGKEIGLYFRDKARLKKKDKVPIISLTPSLAHHISNILDKAKTIYNISSSSNDPFNNIFDDINDKYAHIADSQFKRNFINIISGNIQDNLNRALRSDSKLVRRPLVDKDLIDELNDMQNKVSYQMMYSFRKKLPILNKREELLDLIYNNQVIVVSGETGCGKTTQVAQFILDNEIKNGNGSITRIVCTQPRRISAISIAERVAVERAEKLGHSVGFKIRLEGIPSRDYGSILFCTNGVLLQYMQNDPALRDFSHIILDEIHERTTDCDFIITILKQIMPKRPDLKVILMSATLNSESFSRYFYNCPMIHVPGFTFPVQEFYLEDILEITRFKFQPDNIVPPRGRPNPKLKRLQQKKDEYLDFIFPHIRQLKAENKYPQYVIDQLKNVNSEELNLDLIEHVVSYICMTKPPGAILVFLPGIMQITKFHQMLSSCGRYPQSSYIIYSLHSRLPTVDQKLIFNEPPTGVRKIIISTSIAETSITIEDVVYVVDCGRTKRSNFDVDQNIRTLNLEWISLANAKQRKGRAGRVKEGFCYHLYSKAREMTLNQFPIPEILETGLDQVILKIKILQLGKAELFLNTVMDPPKSKSIELSIRLLRSLNAIDNDENLTPLGYHLSRLPVDPRTGKMIIWAAMFSCIDPVFAIAASLSFKDAFYTPLDKEEEASRKKQILSMGEYSDHIALAEALRRFESTQRHGDAWNFCRAYFLSYHTLKLLSEMKDQFAEHLTDMKFLNVGRSKSLEGNKNSDNKALVKAILCAGLYPNIATFRRKTKLGVQAWTPEDGIVNIHPASVNDKADHFPTPYFTYFMKQRSSAIFLFDTTVVTVPMMLFADTNSSMKRENDMCMITLGSSQVIKCELKTAKIIQELQRALNNMLEYKIAHPGPTDWDGIEGDILKAIIELVSQKDNQFEYDHDDQNKVD